MSLLKNKRFWVDLIIFLLACIAPWWLALAMAIAATFYFRRFFEIIILGLLLDSLYASRVTWFGGFPYALTVLMLLGYIVINYSKTFLRVT